MSPTSKSGTVHLQDNSAKLLLAADAIPPPILATKGEMGHMEIFNMGHKINALSLKLDVQECGHSFSAKETAIFSNCQLRSDLHKTPF